MGFKSLAAAPDTGTALGSKAGVSHLFKTISARHYERQRANILAMPICGLIVSYLIKCEA
jgi:hypothetical protein